MKLLITYTSGAAPDLRELVKALAMKFHCKIELRQSKE
jgi:cell fate regulator YaaT (PSP1 superfamily)